MLQRAIVAFGANLGDRHATAESARGALERMVGPVAAASPLVETEPLLLPGEPPGSQPLYLNGIWIVDTGLSPEACLDALLEIERAHGRVRMKRWDSRTIDLDLIALGSERRDTSALTLPHPEMHTRKFVLEPLCHVWPEWIHPQLGKSARELLQALDR